MSYWYLSFCDTDRPKGHKFLGGCFVEAQSAQEAIQAAWAHGCNPGGEVAMVQVPEEREAAIARWGTNRLLSKQELQMLDEQ